MKFCCFIFYFICFDLWQQSFILWLLFAAAVCGRYFIQKVFFLQTPVEMQQFSKQSVKYPKCEMIISELRIDCPCLSSAACKNKMFPFWFQLFKVKLFLLDSRTFPHLFCGGLSSCDVRQPQALSCQIGECPPRLLIFLFSGWKLSYLILWF